MYTKRLKQLSHKSFRNGVVTRLRVAVMAAGEGARVRDIGGTILLQCRTSGARLVFFGKTYFLCACPQKVSVSGYPKFRSIKLRTNVVLVRTRRCAYRPNLNSRFGLFSLAKKGLNLSKKGLNLYFSIFYCCTCEVCWNRLFIA